MSKAFLDIAREELTVSFCSESKIINQLQLLEKPIIVSSDSLELVQSNYSYLKDLIERQRRTDFIRYHIDSSGKIDQTVLSETLVENETNIMNIVDRQRDGYRGYFFVVDNGLQCLYYNGELVNEVRNILMRTKHRKDLLESLRPVSDLACVFDHFLVECKHKKYNSFCFEEDMRIHEKIHEKQLRNILMKYLDGNIKGIVQTEFCTDFENDEESVDIFLYDGTQAAMIEVKIAFSKANYAGKTVYAIEDRTRKGYEQLDKYAKHLEKDSREVQYGYLYIFHMLNDEEQAVREKVNHVFEQKKDTLSKEFHSMYSATILNDMRSWVA